MENKDKIIAILSITDKGKGIDPEILQRLLTKFATKSSQSTGLGLYLAKSIIEFLVDEFGFKITMIMIKGLHFILF